MTTLVTGGAGFVGMNLVEALLARCDNIVLCDRGALPAAAQRALAPYAKTLTVLRGDILDPAFLQSVFADRRIDYVVHCATITSGPQREARDPGSVIEVNLIGTIRVLEAARQHATRRVIYVGSGALYGASLFRLTHLDEESRAFPETLYSISKYATERICGRLRELWQMDIACVRLGTVIGPWERDTGMRDNYGTHTQLAGMAARGDTAILTPREVRRDWVYAKDVAAGLIALLDAEKPERLTYNLSSGVEWQTPIAAWCDALKAAFPAFDYRIAADSERPNIWYTDKDRNIMNTSRIAMELGYRPRYLRDEAYADFIEWIRRNTDFYSRA